MPLVKMSILNLDTGESVDDENVKVLFNPTEYTIEQSNTWEAQNVQGEAPIPQFTKADWRKLTMELFFDSYEERNEGGNPVDVRRYTDRVGRLMVPCIDVSDGKRPPQIEVRWGEPPPGLVNADLPFKGVILSLRQQFVLFSEQGFPVRAKLNLTIQEYLTPEQRRDRCPQRESFPARTYTIKQGDTLSGIAQGVWKKPEDWRRIALANDILDPRALVAGDKLIIPSVK